MHHSYIKDKHKERKTKWASFFESTIDLTKTLKLKFQLCFIYLFVLHTNIFTELKFKGVG